MASELPMLDRVRIASPCSASWDAMPGDERARFCAQCGKHVYNLSAMTRKEAETLVRQKEGNLCGRFYRRRDGTILTDNCPVGLRAVRRALLFQVGLVASLFAEFPAGAALLQRTGWEELLGETEPFHTFAVRLGLVPPTPPPPIAVPGGISIAPPPPGAGQGGA